MSSRLLERPMLPHPTSRSAPDANAPPPLPLPLPDLALLLEQHVVAGFPADLALDLVLNELVARAADATHATAAALALLRGKQMVCRAATGLHAPDLGVPLDLFFRQFHHFSRLCGKSLLFSGKALPVVLTF